MKKLLLILIALPMIGFGQQTYVPDDVFEQELINLGYDNVLDDYVLTVNINTVTSLDLNSIGGFPSTLFDLTGIEDFINLDYLFVGNNALTSLDLSQNTALTYLHCENNQLTSLDLSQNLLLEFLSINGNPISNLDVSNNTALTTLDIPWTQITNINISQNTALTKFYCNHTLLTSIDVSQNIALTHLNCSENGLTNIDLSQNISLIGFWCKQNSFTHLDLSEQPNLTYLDCQMNPWLSCIKVSDPWQAMQNWTAINGYYIDSQHYFSDDCGTTFIKEQSTNKELLKVTDMLGQETPYRRNTPLFYIYDDGTVEKRIVIE